MTKRIITNATKNAVLHESAEAGNPIVIQLAPEGEYPQFMPPNCRISDLGTVPIGFLDELMEGVLATTGHLSGEVSQRIGNEIMID
jgi:hypothetical protein